MSDMRVLKQYFLIYVIITLYRHLVNKVTTKENICKRKNGWLCNDNDDNRHFAPVAVGTDVESISRKHVSITSFMTFVCFLEVSPLERFSVFTFGSTRAHTSIVKSQLVWEPVLFQMWKPETSCSQTLTMDFY